MSLDGRGLVYGGPGVHKPKDDMKTGTPDWVGALTREDYEALWSILFEAVSHHRSVRRLHQWESIPRDRLLDSYADMTQDLFLRLFEKGRFSHYLEAQYTSEMIVHEIDHIEIPNMVNSHLRQRFPESFRIAGRVSSLLRGQGHYRLFPAVPDATGQVARPRSSVLEVYGLKIWPADKPVKERQVLPDLVKGVEFRIRDLRRAGGRRACHIIIPNKELDRLISDIFVAIDSPTDVRTLRNLVMSKLPLADISFIPMSRPATGFEADIPLDRDYADIRLTPEQCVLEGEEIKRMDRAVAHLIDGLRRACHYRFSKFSKLLSVAWLYYFDSDVRFAADVARMLGISNSLVAHYRAIFERHIREIEISPSEVPFFHNALSSRLLELTKEMREVPESESRSEKGHRRYLAAIEARSTLDPAPNTIAPPMMLTPALMAQAPIGSIQEDLSASIAWPAGENRSVI